MINLIKKYLPLPIKNILKKIFYKIKSFYFEKIKIKNWIENYKNTEKIILFQTPEYGNLGDQAIAIATKKILNYKFNNKLILEFTLEEYKRSHKLIKQLINTKDILYIQGGGNLGNLYMEAEKMRREIISNFSKNKIVIMPQSISFTNNLEGKIEKKIMSNFYSKHKNLHIITRDEKSYEIGKELFKNNNIYIMPDTVLYLEDYYLKDMKEKRENIIFTIRKDKEKLLSNEKINEIIKILEKNNIKYSIDDTTVNYSVNKETRDYEVEKILRKISKSKLNITDRFHGVIFSVITNTPVIVFKSLDHKIEYGVRWFKNLDWVHYVTEKDDLEEIILKYINEDIEINKEKYELKEILKEKFFKI